MKKILITGGAGFIGSSVIRHIIDTTNHGIINVDKLSYAGNLESLTSIEKDPRYTFEQVDICDANEIKRVFHQYQPDAVMHLAAESHVDRSIDGPGNFIQSNIVGTYILLEEARYYWSNLDFKKQDDFRFHHVSTDEVYGDLEGTDDLFTEETPYSPSSPYSATKASADHLIRSYVRTYKLNAVISNCCNNFGPGQFPEKLIPTLIYNILTNKPLPIYGNGKNSREWIYVEDHCSGLFTIYKKGKIGESYNIGTNNNVNNLNLTKLLLKIVKDKKFKIKKKVKIKFVKDRPGHDFRYALNSKKIRKELNWKPKKSFESGLEETFNWYLNNFKFFNNFSKNKFFKRIGLIA